MNEGFWSRTLKKVNEWAHRHKELLEVAGIVIAVLAALSKQLLLFCLVVVLVGVGAVALHSRWIKPSGKGGGRLGEILIFGSIALLAVSVIVLAGIGLGALLDNEDDNGGTPPDPPVAGTSTRPNGSDDDGESTEPPEGETPGPLFAANYVGQEIDAVRDELDAAGIRIIEDPKLGPKDRIGEITAQTPDAGDHLSAPPEIHLTFIGRPEKVNLTGDLITAAQDPSPCYEQWDRGTLKMGQRTYRRGWYWSNDFQCGVRRHVVAITSPEDQEIEEVRAIVGIPANSNEPPGRTTSVTVRIDEKVKKPVSVGLIKPLIVRARNFVRLSITFRAGPYVPVAVGRVWGIRAR